MKCSNRNRTWKYLAWFMIVFCALACVVLTFCLVASLYDLTRVGFTADFRLYLAATVSYTCFVVSFVVLIRQWKNLRLLLRDISYEANAVDATIEKRLMVKIILCLIAVLIFIGYDVGNTIRLVKPTSNYVYHNSTYMYMCFGCNYTTWNENAFHAYFVTLLTLHEASIIAIGCFQVIAYCFLSIALAEITKHTKAQLEPGLERGSLQNLTSLRRRFHRIRKLVDRLNGLFRNVVLFWLGSTLLTTCRNVPEFVSYLLTPPRLVMDRLDSFFWISQLKDLVLLVSLIWAASRLPEECDQVYNYLPYLSDVAASDSKGSRELTLFYQELSSRKLALQAGSCFVITKNLLLSFFGLAVTYTIVFIQFTPQLLNKLSEWPGNRTQKL